MTKKILVYTSPSLEEIEVNVEKGFATSSEQNMNVNEWMFPDYESEY